MIKQIEVSNSNDTYIYVSTNEYGLTYKVENPYIYIYEITGYGEVNKILAVLQKDYSITKITHYD